MNMQKLLTAVGVAFLMHVTAAHAVVIETVTGTYSLSTSMVVGNPPALTYNLNHTSFTASSLSKTNFFTVALAVSCGSGCTNNTASERMNVHFSFTDSLGATGSLDTYGTYQAKYAGAALACTTNPPSPSFGETDCLDWNGCRRPVALPTM
jgi:hypothetical protein